MSRRGASAALLLLLCFAACRHAAAPPSLSPDLAAQLAATPGAHLSGAARGLTPLAVLDRKDYHYALAWAPGSQAVAFSHLGLRAFQLALWRVGEKAPRSDRSLGAQDFDVEGLAYAPDGRSVAAVSREGRVHLLEVDSVRELARAQLEEPLVSVAFHPQGRFLVVGGARGGLAVLSVPALAVLSTLQGHGDEVRALAFAPDGTLYSGGWDRHLKIWEARELLLGLLLQPRADYVQEAFVNDLSLDAKGERLALALSAQKAERTPEVYQRERAGVREPPSEHNAALLLEARSGRVLQRWSEHAGVVATVGLSPDGRSVASGGWDKQLLLFTQGEARPCAQERFGLGVRRVRFSPDGQLLAVAAWTPQNMAQESDPAAVLYRVAYAAPALAQ